MRLLKPSWVCHEGKPIFSVDIHPDGSRFAVGGQGDDCGKVSIWNMAPIKNEEDEMNENVPKLLCQMDNHLACVNCVRWSGNGKYLASGGDDNLVMIWQMTRYQGPMPTFAGGGGKLNIEQWRCVHTLRQHSGDVLDLAWSPDDSYLASASVDNTVTVWNGQRFPEVIQTIKGHTGLVKGVTWDPVGKYLASQSDDKTLKVWRTTDWQQEVSVNEPFLECSGTTHVLRLSWSPDGHYVVSAHAMNNSGPVAKILERDGWKTKMDFVGHRKAITCVRFNPKLFVKKVNGDSTRLKQYSCCAIGCRDRSLSIWLTSLKRPLVVVHDLFDHSIMDVAWSQSGFELLVCSWDGSVAFASFNPEELGKAMSQEEKEKFHKQVYGISISSSKTKLVSSIIENPEMLKIQQRHIMKQQTLANSNKPAIPPPPLVPSGTPTKQTGQHFTNGSVSASPSNSRLGFSSPSMSMSPGSNINILDKQKETRTKDGRRRITPVLVAQMDVNDTPLPFGSTSLPAPSPVSTPPQPSPSTAASIDVAKIRTTSQNMSALDSRIGENATTGFSSRPKPDKVPEKAEMPSVKSTTTTKPTTSVPTTATPPKATTIAVKRKADTPTSGTKRVRKDAHAKSATTASSSRHSREDRTDHEMESSTSLVTSTSRHTVCIPSPAPERTLAQQISGSGGEPEVTLEIENNLGSSAHSVHVLKCIASGKVSWEAMLTSPGIILAGSRNVVCVACANRSLSIFSFCGRRLQPSFILESPASVLQVSGHFILLVTSSGGVYVWDTKLSTVVIKNEPVFPILSGGGDLTIARTSISDRGYPIITLSNQASFSFEPTVGAWMQLVHAEDPLLLNADYQASAPRQDSFYARGPLAQLQGHSTRVSRQGGRLFRSNTGRQQTLTTSHLENQLSVCLTLGSSNEYHFWLLTYIRHLVHSGSESRLREVCEELLGPPHRTSSLGKHSTGWNPKVLGYNRRDLLREILPIVATNIRLQRLFTEFKDQLDAAAPLSVR